MVEIRWHGRGGQGAVASAEMFALAAIEEGKSAQAFPSFGPERRGAPVMAFTRVGDDYIYLRTGITEPDVVVVLDPSIMRATDVTAGIKDGGKIIVNTSKAKEEIKEGFGIKHDLYTVDATKIAMEEVGRPITNTTMMGALARVTNLVTLESLEEQIQKRFPSVADANIRAMRRAYEETKV
ncbi:MAG: pyruvate ferredoxin oxidoreductase subunit gamma [Actinomycetota bacterium]|nr:pyruvate ferredoxin oxidoreductase subunit gamma [Actinomycetota bacterium]